MSDAIRERFTRALDQLVSQLRQDRSILATILCGSLSYDAVWAKSDIDLALVTIDDKKIECGSVSLYADSINVHVFYFPRTEFRKMAEGAIRQSFRHTLLAKGRLLYTHDETIADLFARMQEIGERDTQVQLLAAATGALLPIYKAHKWLITRQDLDYSALWILYAATSLARIEVIGARLLADREVIPQALKLNPALFKIIYLDLLNTKKTRAGVQQALAAVDDYLATRAVKLFAPILDHLQEAGEARSATEIESYFKRHFDLEGVTTACEYLADQGLIGKASTPVQITRRSNLSLQELAFVHLGEVQDEY